MADSTPAVKPEDFLTFLKGYTPERKRAGEKDLIAGRYRIIANQPLPEFSTSDAKAYAVRDEKSPEVSLYALAFENGVPLRQKNIQALKTYRHSSLVALHADGVAEVNGDKRYIVVLDRPSGQRLSDILAQRSDPMPESQLLNQYLRPLSEILVAFLKMGISHNHIHPRTIFITGTGILLGECIGEPSGFSQDYLFEPIDRMLTLSQAKADYAPGADCYAFGMTALHLALGFAPFSDSNKDILIREILGMGPYHTLILPWDLPPTLQDMFRGIFGEGRRDRWDAITIESWLNGRRLNLVMPTSLRDTSRGFEFEGKMYFNRRSLAQALFQHWKAGKELLADNRLARWLKIHAHKPEIADAVARIAAIGSERTAQQEEESLTRIITVLDPAGPLRFKQISAAVEGMGALLAHAVTAERVNDARTVTQLLDSDLIGFWIEQQKIIGNTDYSAFSTKIQKARQHARMSGMGFGTERGLYDLNPGLPCLSPMLNGHHVTTLAEALVSLDAIAREKAATEDVGDVHIAAFIANRLDLNREIKIHEIPRFIHHPALIMLKLLAQAQQKVGDDSFKGLSNWLALKLLPLLDTMHSRARAHKLQAELRAAANKGSVEAIAQLLLGSHAFEADIRDFQKASADYTARRQQIAAMQGTSGLTHYAGIKGRSVAQSVAYGICITTVYITLKSYFNL